MQMHEKKETDRIRLIASDLDGTLLNEYSELSARTAEVLKRAKDAGIVIAAATGRPYDALPGCIREPGVIEYAITSNGTAIYRMSDRSRLYSNTMSRDNIESLLRLLEEYPCPLEIYIDGAAYAQSGYLKDPTAYGIPERSAAYIRATRHACADIRALIRDNAGQVDGIDVIVTDSGLKDEIRARAMQLPDLYVTASVSHYIEFAAGSVSKAAALKKLADMLDIKPEQIMSFGDGENDREMLSFSGIGVAMGNASGQLYECADRVTESNAQDGVAEAIERWIL